MLNPHDLGLENFTVGDTYAVEVFDDLATIYLPRLDYLRRVGRDALREAGTIVKRDFRAFFCLSAARMSDYEQ